MNISKEIKKIMLEEDVTQQVLADRLGIAQPNLAYRLKRNNFTIKDLQKISKALNRDVEIIFKEVK